jgi:transposase-like protein
MAVAEEAKEERMERKRKSYSNELKARVALEAIKGQRTINEIASEYDLHPNQIMQWKKQVLEEMPQIFSDKRKKKVETDEQLQAQLYQQIGQLKVELDWLKKKVGHLN